MANKLLPKHAKDSVDYSRGMKSAHCGLCRHFDAPDACRLVAGEIDPEFWCRLFARKPGNKMEA